MGNNEASQEKVPGKKPACQTQNHKKTLSRIESKTCEAYLIVFNYVKQGAKWLSPADTPLPPGSEVIDRDGLPVAVVKGKELVGYSLITFLMFKSPIKGLCYVQIGALIMEGIHDITLFSELKHYNVGDPKNRAFAIVEPVMAACKIYRSLKVSSLPAPVVDGDPVSGTLEIDSLIGSPVSRVVTLPSSEEVTDVEQLQAIKRESQPVDLATDALLAAFNDDLPEETTFLQGGRRKAVDQFCFKIQFGRLLRRKKKELGSTTEYTNWWKSNRPSEDWDYQEISECARYGAYEELIKNMRGINLQDVDVRNCHKKAMLMIGAYKKENLAALGRELVAKLDSGEVITDAVAKELVTRYKSLAWSPAKKKRKLPAAPKTLQELSALLSKNKFLSSTGKKYKRHLSKLLKSLDAIQDLKGHEAEIVSELTAIFTVFR